MQYIGIDLHSHKFTCNFIQKEANRSYKETYYINPADIRKFLNKVSEQDYVMLEASTNTFGFVDIIKEKVKEVKVVNPLEIRMIYDSEKKSDKEDAEKLAKILRYEIEGREEITKGVYVPEERIRKLRSLYTSYKLIKKEIGGLKNRVRSLEREVGVYEMREIMGGGGREMIEIIKMQVKVLIGAIERLEEAAKELKERILYEGRVYREEIEIMTSIDGISVFTAIGIKADYGDIDRFKNGKKFCSYLRSVPKVDGSGERVYIGKTKKRGRRLSITLLLQGLHHAINKNKMLKKFVERKEGKGRGKIRMAVARKIFMAIYYMLKRKEYYRYRDEKLHQRKMAEYDKFLEKYEKKLDKHFS